MGGPVLARPRGLGKERSTARAAAGWGRATAGRSCTTAFERKTDRDVTERERRPTGTSSCFGTPRTNRLVEAHRRTVCRCLLADGVAVHCKSLPRLGFGLVMV